MNPFPALHIFLLFLQEKPVSAGWLETLSSILTPVAAIGLLVAIVYFFWHGKNREELTKALAEATALADTRGKKIADLKEELSEKAIAAGFATARIKELETQNERAAKAEFRLRAEITDLEKKLGVPIHNTEG